MRILEVHLNVFHIEEMRSFYTDVLEMELLASAHTSFTVRAGTTVIRFDQAVEIPYYHLCFKTGREYFNTIFSKVESRLLPDETGQISMFWKGKQAYFMDPDGNILEILERPYHGEQVPLGWFEVCEVGVPVTDIQETQKFLSQYLDDVVKTEDDMFAFYGGPIAYLVLVKEGRHWYPTNRGAVIHRLEVVVSGKEEAEFQLGNVPYYFKVRKGEGEG